jgi:hypothetical protein
MRVDLGSRQVHMPEQHLDTHELGTRLQEPGCVGVPELMGRYLASSARQARPID